MPLQCEALSPWVQHCYARTSDDLVKKWHENNVLIEDTDCNNNSLDGSLDDIPDSSDIGGISLTSAPIPASTGQDDETLDKQLAHNHANVDKLFSGSSSLGGGGDRHRPF